MGNCLHRDGGRVSDCRLHLVLDTLSTPLRDVERVRSPRPPRRYAHNKHTTGEIDMSEWIEGLEAYGRKYGYSVKV